MATQESERVMAQRKRDYDRVSITIPKEGKYLLHAQAKREGVSVAEMMRRAILARCGLENMPTFAHPHYHAIVTAETKEDATKAIEGLQLDEYLHDNEQGVTTEGVYMTALLSSNRMKDDYIRALLDLLDAVEDADAEWSPVQIKLNKKSLATVRRLLANIEEIPEEPEEDC